MTPRGGGINTCWGGGGQERAGFTSSFRRGAECQVPPPWGNAGPHGLAASGGRGQLRPPGSREQPARGRTSLRGRLGHGGGARRSSIQRRGRSARLRAAGLGRPRGRRQGELEADPASGRCVWAQSLDLMRAVGRWGGTELFALFRFF